MTTAVVRNTSESVLTQENHLVFPCVRAQRPSVTEDYRLSLAPVFIVDTRSVFCSYARHVDLLLYGLRRFGCNFLQPISGLFMGPFELLVAAFVIQRFQAALSRDGTSAIRNLIAAKIVKAIKITRVVSCVTRNDGSV